MRALLGNASHFCEEVVLEFGTDRQSSTAHATLPRLKHREELMLIGRFSKGVAGEKKNARMTKNDGSLTTVPA